VDFLFSTIEGTADIPSDFSDATGIETFGDAVSNVDLEVTLGADNSVFEGPETINLTMRGPTSPAFLAAPVNSQIIITDYEDDTDPPTSEITKPEHRERYGLGMMTIEGTADDGPGSIDKVKVALRQKRTDGSCKWFNGNSFVWKACSKKIFLDANCCIGDTWRKPLGTTLAPSVRTNIKFYTAYSKAFDSALPVSNKETGFETGRNANRFDIK
jgi:hypothetical protein